MTKTVQPHDIILPAPPSRGIFQQQGLLDFAFGPMFGVDGFPSYFYLSYTCQLNDGVSGTHAMVLDITRGQGPPPAALFINATCRGSFCLC